MLPDDVRSSLESLAEELGATTVARGLLTLTRDLPLQAKELRSRAGLKDQTEFKRLAHNLKGRCGMLRLQTLRETAYALELASQDPTATRRLELLLELEQKAQALTPGLQRLQADLSARVE